MPRVDQQPRIDELAWPQQMLLIGKFGSQPDRTGGLDDLVIDEVKGALIELLAVLTIDQDGDGSLGHAFLDGNEVGLRQRENQRDRLDLGDIDQAVDVRRVNDIADIDLSDAGHAIDRRGEISVAEIHPRAFDDRLVGLNRGDELINNRLLRVGELRRD